MLSSGIASCGEGAERETGDGGRRLVASEPVEQSGKGSQRGVDGGVTRVVHVADRQTEMIERGCNVAVLSFEAAQSERQLRFVQPVAAVLSDHQTSASGVKSAGGVRLAEGEAVGEKGKREHQGFAVASAASMRPSVAAIASSPEPPR